MTELSDNEKALLILETSQKEFQKCAKEVRELNYKMEDLRKAFETANRMLKRCLNEEENEGNIHKDCEWYNPNKDSCSNYMMGKYTGLAFNVSKNKECIKDLVNE